MAHSVSFSDRQNNPIQNPDVTFSVETYQERSQGGSYTAKITARGDKGELRRLLDMLRYGVDIYDEGGGWRWGGYIHEVQYVTGRVQITSSMDDVANRCSVGYTYLAPNGQQRADQSTIATDTESIAIYGAKEQIWTRTNIGYEVAQRIADQALADKKFPKKKTQLANINNVGMVTLLCRGWSETFAWVGGGELSGTIENLSDPSGYVAPSNIKQQYRYDHGDNVEDQTIQFGDTAAKLYAAAGFTITGSVPVQITDIKVKIAGIGNPTDDLIVEVRSGLGPGSPQGTTRISGTIKNANIKAAHTWTSVSSIGAAFLSPGQYWLEMHRTGAVSNTQYFRWAARSGGGSYDGYTYPAGRTPIANNALITFMEINAETKGRMLTLGAFSNSTHIAQSVTNFCNVPYSIGKVSVKLGKVGNPSGPLGLAVYPDAAGVPGAISVYSQSIANTDITTEAVYTFQFALSGVGLTAHQPTDVVWLVLGTTLIDPWNYYYLIGTEAGRYTDGNVLTDNGGAGWIVPPGELDLYFSVEAVRMTTDQIKDMATGTAGQFITGCDIELQSFLFAPLRRDGDTTAAKHIQNLLNAGASDGTRMLMRVTRERRLRIFKEPAQGASDYILTSDGRLITLFDEPDTPARVVSGVWARVNDSEVVATVGAEPALFIESAEYNAASRTVNYTVRGQPNPYDILGL